MSLLMHTSAGGRSLLGIKLPICSKQLRRGAALQTARHSCLRGCFPP